MTSTDFQFSFESPKASQELYYFLLDPKNWWFGFVDEIIAGESKQLGDEFTFHAGNDIHYSKQKLMELKPYHRIAWLVTESNLAYLNEPDEWTGTTICFDLGESNGKTITSFSHKGLTPEIACYDQCSNAWMKYLSKLKHRLQDGN